MSAPHWSFNSSRPEQPEFVDQIRETLDLYYGSTRREPAAGSPQDLWFQEFPNFWRGYANNPDQLAIGALRISTTLHTTKRWNYVVDSRNDASGERKRLTFATADDQFRSLVENWQIRMRNCSGDAYETYWADGRFDMDGTPQMTLSINGQSVRVLIPTLRVTGYHCMFDAMPQLASDIESHAEVEEFSVLEDMQSLLGPCRVRFVESIRFEPAGDLRGYCMFGRGCIPSYWWIDSFDRVVIVASTFSTLVASTALPDFTGMVGEGSEP